jgi:hypothetical protein
VGAPKTNQPTNQRTAQAYNDRCKKTGKTGTTGDIDNDSAHEKLNLCILIA